MANIEQTKIYMASVCCRSNVQPGKQPIIITVRVPIEHTIIKKRGWHKIPKQEHRCVEESLLVRRRKRFEYNHNQCVFAIKDGAFPSAAKGEGKQSQPDDACPMQTSQSRWPFFFEQRGVNSCNVKLKVHLICITKSVFLPL